MPRASPRCLFLFFICLISAVLLIINIFFTFNGFKKNRSDTGEESSLNTRKLTANLIKIVKIDQKDKKPKQSVSTQTPLSKLFPSRPWYLSRGAIRPEHGIVNSSGDRTIELFPEESSGRDRITDQLMFLPPAGDIPDNQEDASLPLKKILMWNGVSSWGGVRPGRGEFIKQECPVSTCAIVMDRGQAEQADMVLFKDHFSLPSFKRPLSQIWMIFMLGEIL
jgi:hypothetical protein